MRVRIAAAVAAALVVVAVAAPAQAALRQVHVGNFYFEDTTVGDGKVEITVGDQLQFVVDDGGPGTPHTVEVDALNIHSGSLATGETFTTPPIAQAGTYVLYCKPHLQRGHKTTLIVNAALGAGPTTTATTAPTTTTKATSSTTTTTTKAATAGSSGTTSTTARSTTSTTASATSSTGAGGAAPGGSNATTSSTATSVIAAAMGTPPTGANPTGSSSSGDGSAAVNATTDTALAAVGVGKADSSLLAGAPVQPGSLDDLLGRRPGSQAPWTRSIRLSLLALLPMAGAAGFARRRAMQNPRGDDQA